MSSTVLRDLDQGLKVVPPLSSSAARLLSTSEAAAEADGDALAMMLEKDPELAIRVLGMAGTSLLGLHTPVASPREACLALGAARLRNVVAAAAVIGQFPGDADSPRFDRHGFWEHCAATGALAYTLALEANEDAELAFAAGLLHDVGRIVLDVYFPRTFLAILRYRDRHDVWIRDAEAGVMGFDHCLVGERVARRWKLPEPIVQAIAWHHQPQRPEASHPVTGIVHVADVLARGLQVGNPGDDAIPMLCEQTLTRLNMDWNVLQRCLEQAELYLVEARAMIHRSLQPVTLAG
ncbi:MAG: HDOD domain-containing protein [Ectothiorhodospiraceae bacterium]|nr:HDOD domain-containing protein [Ectothiorhodospiraceae bacterium]